MTQSIIDTSNLEGHHMEKAAIHCSAPREHFKDAIRPVIPELEKRGFDFHFTESIPEDAKIAIYNGHRTQTGPINGDIKIITLHGMDDAYDPSFFAEERWSQYDFGLLPGCGGAKSWQENSWNPMSRPREGCYVVGWPKSDWVFSEDFTRQSENLQQELKIGGRETILYAPTVEIDRKMHNVLSQVDGLCDTLLIKHGPYDDVNYRNIPSETEHGTKIRIVDPFTDIMTVLEIADIVISDQSSVLIEAILVGTVPISILDWNVSHSGAEKYPDGRFPEFVIEIEEDRLPRTIPELVENINQYESQLREISKKHFSNLGQSAQTYASLIERIHSGREIKIEPVEPAHNLLKLGSVAPFLTYRYVRFGIHDALPYGTRMALSNSALGSIVAKMDKIFSKK